MNKRFEKIITMCQKARRKYGVHYEKKYKNKIDKFSEEIKENKLISKCRDKYFAMQLCIMNSLTYEEKEK